MLDVIQACELFKKTKNKKTTLKFWWLYIHE